MLSCLRLPAVESSQYVAPGECTWSHTDPFDVSLQCRVRRLSPDGGLNLSLIQSDHTIDLKISCDDHQSESRLDRSPFSHLRALKSLSLIHCKLTSLSENVLSGLQHLRNLTIRTVPFDHSASPANSLSISSAALTSLKTHLELLDLGFNGMSQLPDDLFCPLTNLKVLNLTRNMLTGFGSLGLVDHRTGHLCLQELQELDLSHNRIEILTETGVASLKNLRALFLHNNKIFEVAELSLSALSKLSVIDLSHNFLPAINSRTFRDSSELRQLYLQNNSLSQIPSELFKGLSKLFVLNLSNNKIRSDDLTRETFLDLIRLVVLDLGSNQLERVNGSVFESQYSLQILGLNDNQISEMSDNAFSSLYNLDTLVLNRNKIKSIGAGTLNGLYVLKKLQAAENDITSIDDKAFSNCSSLHELSLDGNFLSQVPKAISSLKHLRLLGMRHNLITDVKNAPYLKLQHLESIDLSLNKMVNLTRGSLLELPALRHLDLSSNRLRTLDHGVFDDAPGLRSIRLESNHLTDINGLFMNLASLKLLNVSRNRISWFDFALIPKDLTHLDLSGNRIEELGNYFELSSLLSLQWLDASSNVIQRIAVNSIPNKIEYFDASNNQISVVHQFSFKNKPDLRFVDIRNNSLTQLDVNALQLDQPTSQPLPPDFFISNNPYSCDCNMKWLQSLSEGMAIGRYPRIADLETVDCKLPFSREQAVVPLLRAGPTDFLCKYKTHCFALCHCCDFDACDCEMMCPENCTCYYDQTWDTNLVDCSARKYRAIPPRIPMDVTELYIDGNDIHTISSHTFIGRKNMKSLYLNESRIHVISNRTFNGLVWLQVLHLEHNQVSALHGFEFEGLTALRELYLSYNRITVIANNTFSSLKSLQVLHLQNNLLIEFKIWTLRSNVNLQSVQLSGNPWSCDCRFMRRFQEWLQETGSIIRDSDITHCRFNSSSNGIGPYIWNYNSNLCTNVSTSDSSIRSYSSSTSGSSDSGSSETTSPFAPDQFILENSAVIIGASCGFIITLVIVLLICINRKEVKVWVYSKYGVRFFQSKSKYAPETERLFDAFVSYCKMDQAFIAQILAPELECGHPPYRLCLRYRDLPLSGYVAEAITEAIESSHRTIILLSKQYLKSESCRFELKVAHQVCQINRNHQIIAVIMDKSVLTELDPDAKLCLRSCPLIQWEDKMFWEKLRYEMPPGR